MNGQGSIPIKLHLKKSVSGQLQFANPWTRIQEKKETYFSFYILLYLLEFLSCTWLDTCAPLQKSLPNLYSSYGGPFLVGCKRQVHWESKCSARTHSLPRSIEELTTVGQSLTNGASRFWGSFHKAPSKSRRDSVLVTHAMANLKMHWDTRLYLLP